MEDPSRVFSAHSLKGLTRAFSKHKVEYLIIGKSGAILYGFPDTTQDVVVFPEKTKDNGKRIVAALSEIGFPIDRPLEEAIIEGKDFIQIRGVPFDIDLIYAPDGIESFDEAKRNASWVEKKYPVASLDDIIKSKRAASRKKDKEVLERLEDFAKYLKKNQK